ncbi:MAG: thioredoxin [Desulfobulbaceae bacterium]|nr:thioredoxin [Desulfobulbaceae bacterium]
MFCPTSRNPLSLLSLLFLGTILLSTGAAWAAGGTVNGDNIPARGEVTMVGLGAETSLPCRVMAPVIADLKKVYQGKATIVSIDVNRESLKAKKFNALILPTQIFFDRNNKEVYRHGGIMDKAAIVKQLDNLLAQKG